MELSGEGSVHLPERVSSKLHSHPFGCSCPCDELSCYNFPLSGILSLICEGDVSHLLEEESDLRISDCKGELNWGPM